MTFDEIYEKVKKAITLEVKYQYIDFDGRKMNFSKFMITTLKDILKRINKIEKQNISNLIILFESYHCDNILSRKATIDKTLETFARLRKLIAPKKEKTKEKYQDMELENIEITQVKGVGGQLGKIFNRAGIFNIKDLIEFFPRKYINYQGCSKIKDIRPLDNVTLYGQIAKTTHKALPNGLVIINVYIKDSTGTIVATFFYKNISRRLLEHYKSLYKQGSFVMALGRAKYDNFSPSKISLENAQIQILGSNLEETFKKDNFIVPLYPSIEGINPKTLITIINNALGEFQDKIYDFIPNYIQNELKLTQRQSAFFEIHNPKTDNELEKARFRFIFEEMFAMQMNLALLRKEEAQKESIKLKIKKNGLVDKFIKNLPFELTTAQKKVLDEILKDLSTPAPMQRLLQGDVGSGKTVIACIMLLCAIENGYQGAIMAPTEILASQHYKNFIDWLTPLGLSIGLFLGSSTTKAKKQMYADLKNGQIHIAIGTHALIQEKIEFNNLGAIVIDEQHRFGVKQRNALLNKGKMPQMLNMTATPIPRTLALTLHGDLDISIIDELPKGRKPIITTLGGTKERLKAYELIKKEIFFGHQAYIVYPLIEESETISAQAATKEAQRLQETVFKEYKIGLLHGKLNNMEKDEVMNDFNKGKYDILVSTTVVEVGVDNKNATVIVIENAERFGLSQLHQLRGRVGRSEFQSYCCLVSNSSNAEVKNRLDILTKTNDGFIVSQKDLEIRGPGEFLGIKQSGLPDFKLADIVNDSETLELARKYALEFAQNYNIDDYPLLKRETQNYSMFRG